MRTYELGSFPCLLQHWLANLVLKGQLQVDHLSFFFEAVLKLSCSIQNVSDLIALKQLLSAHAAVTVSQEQSVQDWSHVKRHVCLHFVVLDPVATLVTARADL